LLLVTDNEGWNAWHRAAYVGKLDVLHKLCEWVEQKVTTEEINNMLFLVTDSEGKTVWHVAADEGTLDIFLKLWVWSIEKVTNRRKIINN
jgi:ankyrin repeat protein